MALPPVLRHWGLAIRTGVAHLLAWVLVLILVLTSGCLLAALLITRSRCESRLVLERRQVREELGRELVGILRNQRHSFMNHLQVISGWLQLKKPERALDYIEGIRQRRDREGQVLRVRTLNLLTLLLAKASLAEANGVELEWQVDAGFECPERLFAASVESILDRVLDTLARTDATRNLLVRLTGGEGAYEFTVAGTGLPFGDVEVLPRDLLNRISAAGGEFTARSGTDGPPSQGLVELALRLPKSGHNRSG